MNVIITHEQADFDAIASLLGAHISNGGATPILPKKTNRNVQEFLSLYASAFPFQHMSEFGKKPIENVTIVDTQSLITLKGISKNTKISVIDHHQKKKDLPQNWDFTYIPFGATTTFFVEQMREKNKYDLNPLEATLLLLGIYEDTGSLTYTNTTSHDAAAVAYLLTKNANLELASEYLNPPLSSAQQQVFQKLLENCKHIRIYDLDILVATASAPGLDDEVSSIAHKINDLFEPDALFIFVALEEGIRLVARSATNRINTAKITKMYGGGGHQRASAALIKSDDKGIMKLASIREEFQNLLHDHILPAVRVRNIMSKKPLTLSPETTVKEARVLMERYGYEGFPVIQNNRIVGLLNRRAVDKAFAHNLKKTASSLMEAGEFFVTKNDSLDHLQQVMQKSGWGQIPVVSTQNQEIIGIVTRTDLLKAITGENHNNKHQNFANSLKENTSKGGYKILEIISRTASDLDMPVYIVGGFVRDLILDKPSPDLDIVVEGDAIQLSKILVEKYGGKITSHKKFGTAKWWPLERKASENDSALPIDWEHLSDIPLALDLISARTEFYEKPTALPTIRQSSIKLDLHRRDFTINTMAIRLDGDHFGDIYDYWGGLNDLDNGLVRVLHSLSFIDDPTRMLRAVRFEKRFNFKIENRTLELLKEALSLIDDVSGDRIRHELDQIFIEKASVDMLERLADLGILSHIHSSLRWNNTHSQNLKTVKELLQNQAYAEWFTQSADETIIATYILLLCRLLPQDLREVIKRLRFRSNTQQILQAANTLWHQQDNISRLSPGEFTEKLEKFPLIALLVISKLTQDDLFIDKINKYIDKWRKIKIFTNGEDLKNLGIPPGPIYRQLLKKLRVAKINGEITSKQSESKLLHQLIAKMN